MKKVTLIFVILAIATLIVTGCSTHITVEPEPYGQVQEIVLNNGNGTVNGRFYLNKTNVTLSKGEVLTITATGEVCWENGDKCASPEGTNVAWGLYAKIGESGEIVKVDSNYSTTVMDSGVLYFVIPEGTNKNTYGGGADYLNNSGSYNVVVTVSVSSLVCNDWAEIKMNEYIVSNNVWGKGNITNYKQCIFGTKIGNIVDFGWNWTWPKDGGNVKAYPEIIYGWKPWSESSTTSNLPIQIGNINQITVSYDAILSTTSTTGTYNLTFDLWITNLSPPNPNNITREVMIWVETKNMIPSGTLLQRVSISGEDYDFYKGQGSAGSTIWTYLAFVKVSPKLKGSINVHEFLNYLKNESHIFANEYLASIEFGNEIIEGAGETRLQNYSVSY